MRFAAAALVALLVSSCSPTWFQDLKTNPVLSTNNVLSFADDVVDVATVTFNRIKLMLPEDKQAEAQDRFDKAKVIYVKAKQAVRSAVAAAASAGQEKPNLADVLGNVTVAILDVQKLVTEIEGLVPKTKSTAMVENPLYEMNKMVESYKKQVAAP